MKMNIEFPKSYIAWDLETSGLDFCRDRILEIGAAKVVDGVIVERKNWVLQNNIEIPAEITAITGITKELIDTEGRDPKQCMDEFIGYIMPGLKPHLTHNGIRFDIPFLAEQASQILELKFADFELLKNELYRMAIDSAVLAKARKLTGTERNWNESFKTWADRVMEIRAYGVKYNVGICCEEFGIDKSKVAQHRALGDVELTNEIYKKLIS